MWHRGLGAENGLPAGTGRGGDAKGMCLCTWYGYIWDCVTVTLFGCVTV